MSSRPVADVDDGPVRLDRGRFSIIGGRDEECASEEAVPGLLGDHAHVQTIGLVGAGAAAKLEDILTLLEVFDGAAEQFVEVIGGDAAVDFAPPDRVMDARGVFEKLVIRAAAGAVAGQAVERAIGGERSFAASDRFFDELGGRKIEMDLDAGKLTREGRKRWHD